MFGLAIVATLSARHVVDQHSSTPAPQNGKIGNFLSIVGGMTTYTLTEANKRTAEMVNEARYGRTAVMITDHGKPAAAVISPQMLAHYQALEDAADLAEIEAIKARGEDWISNEDAQAMMDQMEAEAEAADKHR